MAHSSTRCEKCFLKWIQNKFSKNNHLDLLIKINLHVCYLKRALYGLKQAPRAWFDRFSIFLLHHAFICSTADSSLFVRRNIEGLLLLLLYVDDIILARDNSMMMHSFITTLSDEFRMKDLGLLRYFLGIEVHNSPSGLNLTQSNYTKDLPFLSGMDSCKSVATPMAIRTKHLLKENDDPYPDPSHYRSIVGAL